MKKNKVTKPIASLRFARMAPTHVRWGKMVHHNIRLLIGITENDRICRLDWAENTKDKMSPAGRAVWKKTAFAYDPKAVQPFIKKIIAGQAVDVLMVGSEFQCAVWKAMLTVPSGETISYAELARRAKRPKAVRAVGSACGANPIPILVPCHRIVASDGTLGGFGGGLPNKIKLLKKESLA